MLVAGGHTEYTQSGNGFLATGVHSIMVRVRGARPPPFTLFTITNKVAVYAPAERGRCTPHISSLPPMYSVAGGFNDTVNDFFTCAVDRDMVPLMSLITMTYFSPVLMTQHEKNENNSSPVSATWVKMIHLKKKFFRNSVTPFL